MGSAAHEKLVKTVTPTMLVNDIKKMTEQVNTTMNAGNFPWRENSVSPKEHLLQDGKDVCWNSVSCS